MQEKKLKEEDYTVKHIANDSLTEEEIKNSYWDEIYFTEQQDNQLEKIVESESSTDDEVYLNPLPKKKGELKQMKHSLINTWQNRLVKLNKRKLVYYENEDSKVICGVLNFNVYQCTVEVVDK